MSEATPEMPAGDDQIRDNAPTGDVVEESEYAQGRTSDPDGTERDADAGEDYAGSGF